MRSYSILLLLTITLIFFGLACREEDSQTGFVSSGFSCLESDSLYEVPISLGEKVDTPAQLTIELSGSAGLDADFVVPTNVPVRKTVSGLTIVTSYEPSQSTTSAIQLTVLPGQSSITVPIQVVDDSFIEPDDKVINLKITGGEKSGLATLKNNSFRIVIHDNDSPPPQALQVDLSWILTEGGSINQANFDLYLVKNILFNGGTVQSYKQVDGMSSEHEKGYESLSVGVTVPDDKYYLMVHYTEGTSDASIELILSKDHSYWRAKGKALSTDEGTNLFYGPITKNGTRFSSNARIVEPSWYSATR